MIEEEQEMVLDQIVVFDISRKLLTQRLSGVSARASNVDPSDLALSLRHAPSLPAMTVRVTEGRIEVVRNSEMLAVAEALGRDNVRVLVDRGSEETPQVKSLLSVQGVELLDFRDLRDQERASGSAELYQLIRFRERVDVLLKPFELGVLRKLEEITMDRMPLPVRCEITEVIEPHTLEYVLRDASLGEEDWYGPYIGLLRSFDKGIAKIETWQGKTFSR